jgi:uncharacterized protein YggE
MNRVVLLVAIAALFGAAPAMAQMPGMSPPVPSIVTQGEATLKRAPDRAWINVSTEARDPQAAPARSRNAEAMTALQAALKSAGVSADAIRTTQVSVTPEFQWNNGKSTLRGYVARNQIEVRVDDLDKLSDILDAANSPKNVALSVTGPRFDLKNERAVQSEALSAAVQDALQRAQAIATGAKRSLGAIVRIEDQNTGMMLKQPIPMMMARAEAASDVATPVTPGEIEIRAQVVLTVEMR